MNNDDFNDSQEFAELGKSFKEDESNPLRGILESPSQSKKKDNTVQPTQYSLYADGYAPMTPTIDNLPAGFYQINQDEKTTYASPMNPPAGLLLELPEMKSAKILEITETFWNSEKDYKEGNEFVIGGAQYKAGALLYGPPGSGKTSVIKLAAQKMIDRGGIVFYSSIHPEATSNFLTKFSKIEPHRKCVVVLEDLDSLIDNYGEHYFLEMLDSARTIDNVFFIATTNYPEKLDPRIYSRPGRFSHVVKIGLPSKITRKAFLQAVLKNYRDVDYIIDHTDGFTIDHISSLISAVYREKKNLKSEIERLRVLFIKPKSDDTASNFGLNTNEKDNE